MTYSTHSRRTSEGGMTFSVINYGRYNHYCCTVLTACYYLFHFSVTMTNMDDVFLIFVYVCLVLDPRNSSYHYGDDYRGSVLNMNININIHCISCGSPRHIGKLNDAASAFITSFVQSGC